VGIQAKRISGVVKLSIKYKFRLCWLTRQKVISKVLFFNITQKFTNLLVQLSIFLIDLFVGTYRLSSHARLEAFVIQTKLKTYEAEAGRARKSERLKMETKNTKITASKFGRAEPFYLPPGKEENQKSKDRRRVAGLIKVFRMQMSLQLRNIHKNSDALPLLAPLPTSCAFPVSNASIIYKI